MQPKTALLLMVFALNCARVAAQEIDAPHARVLDKSFLAVMGVEALAKSADMLTTAKHMNRVIAIETLSGCTPNKPGDCQRVTRIGEANRFYFGSHPSNTRLAAESAGIFAGEAALTYYLKRKQVKFWWTPAVLFAADHTRLAWHNTRY